MSQLPQHPQQLTPYLFTPDYANLSANPRPTSVTSLAIIGIIIGAMSSLSTGVTIFFNAIMLGNGGKNPLAPQLPPAHHRDLILALCHCIISGTLAVILLICSIAALHLKPFARKVIIRWSWVKLGWTAVLLAEQIIWVGPRTERMLAKANPNAAAFFPQHAVFLSAQVLGFAIMAALPICFLIFWNKPHVRSAFGERTGFEPASN